MFSLRVVVRVCIAHYRAEKILNNTEAIHSFNNVIYRNATMVCGVFSKVVAASENLFM